MTKHIIRTSDRIACKRCRRAWDLGSIVRQNYIPTTGRKPLEFGTAWHAALEVYYNPETWDEVLDPHKRHIIQILTIAKFNDVSLEQQKKYLDDNGDLTVEAEIDFKERKALGTGMLQNYFEYAPTVDDFRPVYREIDFEVPVLGPDGKQLYMPTADGSLWPVYYQGKIDGIIQDKFGSYWIWEDKTAAQFSDANLELDEQTGSYAWAVQQMLRIPIKGVIYNEALKAVPSTPLRLLKPRLGRNYSVDKKCRSTFTHMQNFLLQQGEELSLYEDYLNNLRNNGNPFFKRTPVRRNEAQLKNQGLQIYDEAQDMFDPNIRIYPNPSRFHCGWCSFKQVCLMMNEDSDYEMVLEWDFRQRSTSEVEERRARA